MKSSLTVASHGEMIIYLRDFPESSSPKPVRGRLGQATCLTVYLPEV